MKNKSRTIVIFGIIFLSFFLLSASERSFTIDYSIESPQIGNTYVPEGLIAMWSGPLTSIPEGWVLCDGTQNTPNTTNRFIMNTNGTEDSGTIGGATNHTHSFTDVPFHGHGSTGTEQCEHEHTYTAPTGTVQIGGLPTGNNYISNSLTHTGMADGIHSHTTNVTGESICNTTEVVDLYPPYHKLAYIRKNTSNPIIPAGVIVIWNSTAEEIPQGWSVCNGTNNTPNLEGRLIMGETMQNPGSIGGHINHTHNYTNIPQHSHSTSSNGDNHEHDALGYNSQAGLGMLVVGIPQLQYTEYADVPHTHTMSGVGQAVCTTEEGDHQPPYTNGAYIMSTQVNEELPEGSITLWDGTVADIPIGWDQCDGSYGTLDLRDKFMKCSSSSEPIGSTGGALTHNHTYTEIPLHTHLIQTSNLRHRHEFNGVTNAQAAGIGFSFTVVVSSSTSSSTTLSSAWHHHNILPAGIISPQTDTKNNLPPYIELIFIQNLYPVTSIGWISPEEDTLIVFPRTPTIQFDFEYSWTGMGTDITLSFSNGTDNHDAGSVWGLNTVSIPYLDGEVDATLYLFQDSTEIIQATRSFTFINNRDPIVEITHPIGGETVQGEYRIQWTASDPDDDSLVYKIEFNREDTGWIEIVDGLTHSSYMWDTKTIENSDSVKIRVTAIDGYGGVHENESDAFKINNKKIPGFNVVLLSSILVTLSLILVIIRKKQTK